MRHVLITMSTRLSSSSSFGTNRHVTARRFLQSRAARVALAKALSQVRFLSGVAHVLMRPAVNLVFSLVIQRPEPFGRRLRVGVLDLDVFGPSVPTLMGLQHTDKPPLTAGTPPYSLFPISTACRRCLRVTSSLSLSQVRHAKMWQWFGVD